MRLRRYIRRKGSYLNAVFSLFNEFDRQTKKTRKREELYYEELYYEERRRRGDKVVLGPFSND